MSKMIKIYIVLINHGLCKMFFEYRAIDIIEVYIQAHIFKKLGNHIFSIISLSYESLKDQSNYIQQLSRGKPISSS